MLKKENKVKKFLKKKTINIKGKINKVLRKNIVIDTLNIILLIFNIYAIFAQIFWLFFKDYFKKSLMVIIILLLSVLNRIISLFNNQIKKVTLYSDLIFFNYLYLYFFLTGKINLFLLDGTQEFENNITLSFYFLCYLYPIGNNVYTKFLKE